MTALPSVILPCLDDAVGRAAALVDHAVEHAAESLEQELRRRDSIGERQELGIPLRELLRLRAVWRARFPQVLRKGLEDSATGAKPSGGMTLRPSSLTLVDETELMRSIEVSRLAQELAARVERPLADLDVLMSSALGLEGVQPDQNPLRPDVFAQALRDLMAEDAADPAWPAIWMRHMAVPIAQDLAEIYNSARELLTKARVQAAGYRVITAPAPLEVRGASRPAPLEANSRPAPPEPTSMPAALAHGLNSIIHFAAQALRGPFLREFLSRDAPQARQPLAASYYQQLEHELESLAGQWDEAPYDPAQDMALRQVPAVDRPVRAVGTASPLAREWGEYGAPRRRALVRTQLKKQAEVVGQVIGLELVRQLLDQVAQDPRLLAPVREAIVALEPALGRLALRSPRFFGEATNPARQLLEQVADRSLRYNDEFSAEFEEFFADVRASFSALNSFEQLADARPFQVALQHLHDGWQRQDEAEADRKRRIVEAVQAAEHRQAVAEQIAWDLSQRSDLSGVPAVVQEFVYGRWALVIAQARIAAGGRELDPGGCVAVVSDLLWSVKRESTLRDPARAFELIPRVVMKLRAGLALIGDQPVDSDAFFAALEHLHRPVMKLRAKHRHQNLQGAAAVPADIDLTPVAAQVPQKSEELWLAPDELHACGFQDTVASDFAELAPAEAAHEPVPPAAAAAAARTAPPTLTPSEADGLIARMSEGCWVDLYARRRWRRAQLTWASSTGTLFMFTSHGGRPHSMTRRSLQRLLCSRLMRPVEGGEVVQHALDALAQPVPQPMAA